MTIIVRTVFFSGLASVLGLAETFEDGWSTPSLVDASRWRPAKAREPYDNEVVKPGLRRSSGPLLRSATFR